MTDGPVKASDVQLENTLTDRELLAHRARRAARAKVTRHVALDKAGAFGEGTPGHIENLEERSKREAEERMARFRQQRNAKAAAKAAVKARVA